MRTRPALPTRPLLRHIVLTTLSSLLAAVMMISLASAQTTDKLGQEKLQQLTAPIALYPDPLLAQILMAATYPLEVVEAARWRKANPGLKGKALEDAVRSQTWDPAIKALTAVPDVLDMMSEKLQWTHELGDAVLAQQEDVMTAIQALRQRAAAAGQLKTTPEQTVTTQPASSGSSGTSGGAITIEPAQADTLYVPAYDPEVVYGSWPYPDYPPYAWYPAWWNGGRVFGFAAAIIVGAAIWGNCDWARNRIGINVNRYNRFNRTNIRNANWEHNSAHRKGVRYSNAQVASRFGKNLTAEAQKRNQVANKLQNIQRTPKQAQQLKQAAGKQSLKQAAGKQALKQAAGKQPKVAQAKKRPQNKKNVMAYKPQPKIQAHRAARSVQRSGGQRVSHRGGGNRGGRRGGGRRR